LSPSRCTVPRIAIAFAQDNAQERGTLTFPVIGPRSIDLGQSAYRDRCRLLQNVEIFAATSSERRVEIMAAINRMRP